MDSDYQVPKSLTILAGIFLAIGAVGVLAVTGDILWRRGWRSMMLIMIPTYIINAGYMPLAIYVYFKYGRPEPPAGKANPKSEEAAKEHGAMGHNLEAANGQNGEHPAASSDGHSHQHHHDMGGSHHMPDAETPAEHGGHLEKMNSMHAVHAMHAPRPGQPMWATVAMGVSHCGGGCVLGDLVGEWLVWGTGATINGRDLWPCLLVDYGFALLFGIVFQYLSIAPMTGEWGPKTIWRAAKADILSLTFFEIGLFGWMVIYEVAIWDYRLEMDTWTYWWMMQIGMFFGFLTAMPINWWLLVRGIKAATA